MPRKASRMEAGIRSEISRTKEPKRLTPPNILLPVREHDGFEHFDVRRQGGHEQGNLGDLGRRHHRFVVLAAAAARSALDHHVAGVDRPAGYTVLAALQR